MHEGEPVSPTIDVVHKDIALGNSYRIELDKLLLTLATALFAFSASFVPTLKSVGFQGWMVLGWSCLALSMGGGVIELYGWERFYLSYRDFDFKGRGPEGVLARKRITAWRTGARAIQIGGFVGGALALGVFYSSNFIHIKLAS